MLRKIKQLLFPKKIKIVLGAGSILQTGWILTDINKLNVTKPEDFVHYCKKGVITNLFAEHVWEHLTDSDTAVANRNCFTFLATGGALRIAVPDGFFPDEEYINHVKPGGIGPGADDHKILYNYQAMRERLQKAGFEVKLLEYWDEKGKFHYVDWTDDAGHVRRSRRYDPRNQNGQLKYTSLIVDAIKP